MFQFVIRKVSTLVFDSVPPRKFKSVPQKIGILDEHFCR
jgi:hypothetical protein